MLQMLDSRVEVCPNQLIRNAASATVVAFISEEKQTKQLTGTNSLKMPDKKIILSNKDCIWKDP